MNFKELEKEYREGKKLPFLLARYSGKLSTEQMIKRLGYRGSIKKLQKDTRRELLKIDWESFSSRYFEKKGKKIGLRKYKKIREKAFSILCDFRTDHSMGFLRCLYIDDVLIAEHDRRHQYSGRRWRANHGYISISLSLREIEKIEKIEGLWTVRGREGRAKWLVQKGRYKTKIEWEKGYCIGSSHAKTKREALRMEVLKIRDLRIKKRLFVGIEDFRKLGACNAGIEAFLQKVGIDPEKVGGVRLDWLEELAREKGAYDELSAYTKRLIRQRNED